MKTNLSIVLGVVAVILATLAWTNSGTTVIRETVDLGASGTRFPNGISADTTSPVRGQVRGTTLTVTGDATVSGGTLNVTTSNTATSTVVAGCIQFYATSTQTAHMFQASTTPGPMLSVYGTCPNL